MARSQFGGTASDWVFTTYRFAGRELLDLAAATLTFWDAAFGGTRYTDLRDALGNTVTSIPVAADGQIPVFSGPDGVTVMWADAGSGQRVRMITTDATAIAAERQAAESAKTAAQTAKTGAETARTAAEAAAAAATAPTDTVMAAKVNDPASQTRAALSATIATLAPAIDGSGKILQNGVRLDSLYGAPPGVADLTYPLIIPHRGGANVFPENTLAAYQAMYDLGFQCTEAGDYQLLADGGIANSHDATIDRLNPGSGNVSDFTIAAWRLLKQDPATWFNANWPDQPNTVWGDVSAALARKMVLFPEAKDPATAVRLVQTVLAFNAQESVVIQCANYTACKDTIVAQGCHAMYLMPALNSQTPAQIQAAGIEFVAMNYVTLLAAGDSSAAAWVASMKAVGARVIVYTTSRHNEFKKALTAWGADGCFSDDPHYSKGALGNYSYRVTKLPLKTLTFPHGHQAGASGLRGVFDADGWGLNDTINAGGRTVLAGNISPLSGNPNATAFTLDFTIKWMSSADANRFVGFYVCASDDTNWNDNASTSQPSGYRCLINGSGMLQIQKSAGGVYTGASTGNVPTAGGLTYPVTITGQIIVTPTQVKMTRTDTGTTYTATLNDDTARGGYVWMEMSGVTARIQRLEQSA